MHMADALLSPLVGGVMLAATAVVTTYSVKKVQSELDDKKIPLMGVMGAFVFAAQMINFAIPGTGSSGHIGGGLLLAILLGPYGGFLSMASVLCIQALFFADGGLLALGANIFNLGFYTCFIAYPLIYMPWMKKEYTSKRIFSASVIAAVLGLQLSAFSVVLQTYFSGKTELPFGTFILMMQPIHLVIGIIEGLVTAAVVSFVWKARPEVIEKSSLHEPLGNVSMKKVITGLLVSMIFLGGAVSWFASSNPDGLEWAIMKTAGTSEIKTQNVIYTKFSEIQGKLALLPDYSFKVSEDEEHTEASTMVNAGTSVSGILGGAMTLGLAVLTGGLITLFKRRKGKIDEI